MTNFRTMLLSTAAVGLMTVSSASAADVEKKMAWSGFVNRVIITGDDGENNFISHSDPVSVGQTRGRIKASAKSDAMTIGATIELGLTDGDNASQFASGGESFSVRHSVLYVSNAMGKVTMGHTSHAGEAYTVSDVSGTGIAMSHSGSPFADVLFNDQASVAGSAAAGVTAEVAQGGGYSAGRNNGISYTTPKFNGFTAMASHVTDASGAFNVKYGGNFNGVKVSAGYSFTNMANSTAAIDTQHGGGVGIELPTGMNLSVSYREEEKDSANTAPDGNNMMVKLGYKLSGISDLGGTNVALMYQKSEDQSTTGDEFTNVSLLFTQSLSDYGTTVYGGFSNLAYDTTATNFDDIDGFFMGAKVDF